MLYYVEGDFMSRKGMDYASITLHPGGIPHGSHPGKAEASIGAEETDEYAVMIDTFKPMYVTEEAIRVIRILGWKGSKREQAITYSHCWRFVIF